MAWTQTDLDNIRKHIASGVRSVTFEDGRKREFQNLDQMIAAEKVIAAQLQVAADTISGRRRHSTPYYKSGL